MPDIKQTGRFDPELEKMLKEWKNPQSIKVRTDKENTDIPYCIFAKITIFMIATYVVYYIFLNGIPIITN